MKLALKILGVLILLALAAPIGLAMWLQSYVSADYLVKMTEENCNCRAQLDSTSLSLFSWPPTLRLNGIKIAPRDEHVGKPLSQRPPMPNADVRIDFAYAELLSDDILDGRITPNLLRFTGIEVHETLDPKDGSSLERLFQRPGSQPVASAAPPATTSGPSSPPPPVPGAPRTYDMNGSTPPPVPPPPGEPMVTMPVEVAKPERIPLREIHLEQATFHITNKAVAAQIDAEIRDFDLHLTDIDVDPEALSLHNRIHAQLKAKVSVKGMAQVNGQMKPVQFADASLHGEGDVKPLDPQTMLWKPAATLAITFERGSVIGGHMTLNDVAGDHLEKMLKNGIDLRNVRLGGPLAEDAVATIGYDREMIAFQQPTHIVMPDFELNIQQGGWINPAQDSQQMPMRVVFGPAIREPLIQGIAAKGLGDGITRTIVSMISDDRGNPYMDIIITGSLSHPQVEFKIVNKLDKFTGGAIGRLLENPQEAKELLNDLKSLKNLFKRK